MNTPTLHGSATSPPHLTASTVMGPLASRARMTEGQLYTTVIAVLAVLLLTLTGLPGSGREATPAPVESSPAGTVAP